ncbi:MAG: hypothetical protein IIA81_07080 [Thaumarchaeota archaeon]|nr:hypothetical protein [Nitrososphaerota archaeon]
MDRISVYCNHGDHVDIIEKKWEGKNLLLYVCQDCKDYLQEIWIIMNDSVPSTRCDHKTIDILDLSFIDKKYTHVPVCKHQKEHLEPWLNLRKVLTED